MNTPQPNSPSSEKPDDSRPSSSPALVRDGLGLPRLSAESVPAHDSNLEPDEAVDLDETVRKDKETAEKEDRSSPPRT